MLSTLPPTKTRFCHDSLDREINSDGARLRKPRNGEVNAQIVGAL